MADTISDARARAEARRQKILSRPKDRLIAITGAYTSGEQDPQSVPPEPSPAAPGSTAAQAGTSAAATAPAASLAPQHPHQPCGTVAGSRADAAPPQPLAREDLDALLAAVGCNLQRAHAALAATALPGAAAASASTSLAAQPTTPHPAPHLPAGAHTERAAGQAAAAGVVAAIEAPPPAVEASPAAAAVVARAVAVGHALGAAAQRTQRLRLALAVALAYAAVSGALSAWAPPGLSHPHPPPLLLLLATDASLLAGALLLGALTPKPRTTPPGARPEAAPQLPFRLRRADWLALFPWLGDALGALSGYQQAVGGMYGDAAAYLVACGLMLLTLPS